MNCDKNYGGKIFSYILDIKISRNQKSALLQTWNFFQVLGCRTISQFRLGDGNLRF